MATKIEIWNMALARLGAATVTADTDTTQEANLCNAFYDEIRDRATVQGSWSTAIFRTSLASTGVTPSFEYSYEFQLPVDPRCLKVLTVDENSPGAEPFAIEGDKLYSDSSSVKIKYIGRIEDEEDFGPLLTEAIEILLASYLAYPLTGDRGVADRLRQEYFGVSANNLAVDGQQGSKQTVVSSDLTEIR